MAEKAGGGFDPGGDGGGFGGGGGGELGGNGWDRETIDEDNPRFDRIADEFEDANRHDHELSDPSDPDTDPPHKKKAPPKVAPPAPPIDHNAPLGSPQNPIISKGRGGLY